MEELFNQLNLEHIGNLKHNQVLLVKKTNSTDTSIYCLKMATVEQEIKLFRDCFPKVDQDKLRRLKLPTGIKIGSLFLNKGWWVLMEYYGNDIIKWDESDPTYGGGKSISTDYVDILVDMLLDLKTLDTNLFANVIPIVDQCPWYINLIQKAQSLMNQGLLLPDDLQRVINLFSRPLSEEQKRDYIVTNGDFQFRNFIKQPDGKIVVIDWTENSFNTPNIEPIEFPIMYQWTLMWSNPEWQNLYVKKAMEAFNINKDRLNYALVVKSINQASLWTGSPLAKIQVEHCIRGLNDKIISLNVS